MDTPGTSRDYCGVDDCKAGSDSPVDNTVYSPVCIGNHKIGTVGTLKYLEKKPIEDYFEGTKKKKQSKGKIVVKREVYSLKDFDRGIPKTGANDFQKPSAGSSREESIKEEDKTAQKLWQLKLYTCQKRREYQEKKNDILQKLAEENYQEELETIAETWVECKKRGDQLKQTLDYCQSKKPLSERSRRCNRIGCSIIPRKYWNDDRGGSSKNLEKEEEKRKISEETRQRSSCEELGEDLTEKLVFIYDEDSDES